MILFNGSDSLVSSSRRLLSLSVATSIVLAGTPALAASAADEEAPAAEAAPAAAGGTVALLRFSGDSSSASSLREGLQGSLAENGYTVKGVRRTIEEAQKKNKCRELDAECHAKIGAYLNKNAKTPFDFYVYGVGAGASGEGRVVIYDIAKNSVVVDQAYGSFEGDYIVESVLPAGLARMAVESQVPPAALSAEEQAIVDNIDERKRTPAEIEEENKRILEEAAQARSTVSADAGEQEVDLRRDFKDFCRTGPREDKTIENPDGTTDVERDLRPVCKRGPVFGYWQPRAWVALTLTAGAAVGTGVLYGLALGARSEWKDAKTKLENSGLSDSTPLDDDCGSGDCYSELAGAVSEAGQNVRKRALLGDVFLGSTVLLAGVLAVIIWQDRNVAKNWIAREKELRISDLQLGPTFDKNGGGGLAASFRF